MSKKNPTSKIVTVKLDMPKAYEFWLDAAEAMSGGNWLFDLMEEHLASFQPDIVITCHEWDEGKSYSAHIKGSDWRTFFEGKIGGTRDEALQAAAALLEVIGYSLDDVEVEDETDDCRTLADATA